MNALCVSLGKGAVQIRRLFLRCMCPSLKLWHNAGCDVWRWAFCTRQPSLRNLISLFGFSQWRCWENGSSARAGAPEGQYWSSSCQTVILFYGCVEKISLVFLFIIIIIPDLRGYWWENYSNTSHAPLLGTEIAIHPTTRCNRDI